MRSSVRKVKGVAIVNLSGKITLGYGDVQFREVVNQLFDSGERRILLNMAGVDFVDSAGNGVIIASVKRAWEKGVKMKVLKPSQGVMKQWSMHRLDLILELFDDEQKAIDSFEE